MLYGSMCSDRCPRMPFMALLLLAPSSSVRQAISMICLSSGLAQQVSAPCMQSLAMAEFLRPNRQQLTGCNARGQRRSGIRASRPTQDVCEVPAASTHCPDIMSAADGQQRCSFRLSNTHRVSQCLLHMPQLLPDFRTFAVLPTVTTANSIWGVCSKHHDTSKTHVEVTQHLTV